MQLSSNIDILLEAIKDSGLDVEHDVFASNLTTYRIGGKLDNLVNLNTMADVKNLSNCLSQSHMKLAKDDIFILGNGSNVIVADSGFRGIVFKFGGELADIIDVNEDQSVNVGAGMLLPKFARKLYVENLTSCEFYVGIPGSVGGAVAMNAGGQGKQTSDVLVSALSLNLGTGDFKEFSNLECKFEYRKSIFTEMDMIISATYKCLPMVNENKEVLDNIVKWRRSNQPGGRNIGSVFQNDITESAGSLIEKCDLKGFRIGGAFVSEKHANFIQADEGASAIDVISLINHVRDVVKKNTGIELKNEVRYIGFN